MLRNKVRYVILAALHGEDLSCYLGYRLRTPEGYPVAYVNLRTQPGAVGREASIAVMKRIALLDGREGYKLDEPKAWAMARRMVSLASVLGEEDHVAALQRFFAESIRKLGEELAAFKYDHQELPWEGY